jgi:hypothetical protein
LSENIDGNVIWALQCIEIISEQKASITCFILYTIKFICFTKLLRFIFAPKLQVCKNPKPI